MPKSPKDVSKPDLKPVKFQGIEVPLYRLGDGRIAFSDSFGGPRKVRKFSDDARAREEAKKLIMQVLRGEALRTELDRGDVESYKRALEILRPTGIPLTVAISEFVEAWTLSKGRPILDVVRNGVDNLDRPTKTVAEVYELFIQAKQMKGLSEVYVDKMSEDLQTFGETFGMRPISSITSEEIQLWLHSRKVQAKRGTKDGKEKKAVGMRRRNNLRGNLVTLFLFARGKTWLPKGAVAPQEIEKGKERNAAIEVFTPLEMRFWIANVRDVFFPWLVIGAFSGVRSEEICPPPNSKKDRLRWEDFNWKKAHINIRPEVSKTNKRRLVPIADNLMAWLEPFKNLRGEVIPQGMRTDRESARLSRMSERLTKKAAADPIRFHHPCPGLKWRHNALRHSYCSYRVAIVKSEPQVSLEAGNSVAMIKKSYNETQEDDVALEYFAIRPANSENVIQLRFGSGVV